MSSHAQTVGPSGDNTYLWILCVDVISMATRLHKHYARFRVRLTVSVKSNVPSRIRVNLLREVQLQSTVTTPTSGHVLP